MAAPVSVLDRYLGTTIRCHSAFAAVANLALKALKSKPQSKKGCGFFVGTPAVKAAYGRLRPDSFRPGSNLFHFATSSISIKTLFSSIGLFKSPATTGISFKKCGPIRLTPAQLPQDWPSCAQHRFCRLQPSPSCRSPSLWRRLPCPRHGGTHHFLGKDRLHTFPAAEFGKVRKFPDRGFALGKSVFNT